MDTKKTLRNEYRRTWEAFSRYMKIVNELQGCAEPGVLDAARREAELAFTAYRDARNRLADMLAPTVAAKEMNRVWVPMPAQMEQSAVCR